MNDSNEIIMLQALLEESRSENNALKREIDLLNKVITNLLDTVSKEKGSTTSTSC